MRSTIKSRFQQKINLIKEELNLSNADKSSIV